MMATEMAWLLLLEDISPTNPQPIAPARQFQIREIILPDPVLSSHLCLGLPGGLIPSVFPTKFIPLLSHLCFVDLINLWMFLQA
jgi:hypothetical protein